MVINDTMVIVNHINAGYQSITLERDIRHGYQRWIFVKDIREVY
jgi:hypothetical protein